MSPFAAAGLAALVLGAACAVTQGANPPGTDLFADTNLPRFAITLSLADIESLRKEPLVYVRGQVTVDGQEYRDVGIRLKGRGSFRPLEQKPSLAVKFDEFVPRQNFRGLPKVLLNNASQDPTLLSEWVAATLFRDAQVAAARVTHARVELNGRDLGFHVLVEAMNKTFLRQHFRNPNGPLYEGYAQDLDRRLDQDSGPVSDQSEVRELVAAAALPVDVRAVRLRELLDVDQFHRFLAVTLLIAQHDSYPNNRNNYRLYRSPDERRFVFLPHGVDGSFSVNSMPLEPPDRALLCRALYTIPAERQLYLQAAGELFTNVFRMEMLRRRIEDAVRRLQHRAKNEEESINLARHGAAFLRRVRVRHQRLQQMFAGVHAEWTVLGPEGLVPAGGWEGQVDAGHASLEKLQQDGVQVVRIRCGDAGATASWRTDLRLQPGRYQFAGRLRSVGVKVERAGVGLGAGLRVSRSQRTHAVSGDSDWTAVTHDFVVRPGEEDVPLICELRALAGEVFFDLDSLKVRRLE